MRENIAYIGIGANLGNAVDNVKYAVSHLGNIPGTRVEQVSSLYRTEPIDSSGDDYINAVAKLATQCSPHELLHALWDIENAQGRKRPYRNAPRTLDLDILLYNDELIATDELVVPHPRMAERAFVLVPLSEIDPLVTIPGKEKLSSLLQHVSKQRIDRI